MIIGFLGKGGSGKSTLSTALARHLHARGNVVLAIDADHNMDLAWNLTGDTDLPYLGESIGDMNEYAGISKDESYKNIFLIDIFPKFSLSPMDPFTKKYSKAIEGTLSLMASGPHTETILGGNKCSHSLSTSLKIYLPFLELKEDQAVVVDEKASSDAAGTGVPTGFTVSYIVVEPTLHSIKAAHQIAHTLDFYNAPYEFILNKVADDESKIFALSNLQKPPLALFTLGSSLDKNEMEKLSAYARNIEHSNPEARKKRSLKKFKLS
jgi:CO dehydrogenase maturation factor